MFIDIYVGSHHISHREGFFLTCKVPGFSRYRRFITHFLARFVAHYVVLKYRYSTVWWVYLIGGRRPTKAAFVL